MTARYADACPECPPGDHPAVAPSTTVAEDGGSVRCRYVHTACGEVWDCWWDPASVWPSAERPQAGEPQPLGVLLADFATIHPDPTRARTP